MKDEITASIEELDRKIQEQENAASQNEEIEPASEAQADEQAEIPEKFKGKSAAEIAKAYAEAEKHMHKVSSDKSYLERKVEEQERRMAELQQQLSVRPQHTEEDPLESFDQSFDEDPKEAIKKTLKAQREQAKREKESVIRQTWAEQSKKLYEQKAVDKDFLERQNLMQQQVQRYGHLLRQDMLTHPDTIEVLDLLSRGASVDRYVKSAEDRTKKERDTVREEKRNAFSESSSAQGETESSDNVDFMSLRFEEMEKHLQRLEQKLGRSSR